jgi:hypothetical protein
MLKAAYISELTNCSTRKSSGGTAQCLSTFLHNECAELEADREP